MGGELQETLLALVQLHFDCVSLSAFPIQALALPVQGALELFALLLQPGPCLLSRSNFQLILFAKHVKCLLQQPLALQRVIDLRLGFRKNLVRLLGPRALH